MSMLGKLLWYARRLSRMSVREIAHRVQEIARKGVDRRSRRDWSAFGQFEGPLTGLDWRPASPPSATTTDAVSGALRFLNQTWPDPDRADWWNGDIWRLDPVSGQLWPGAETSSFDISYRDEPSLGDVKFVWEINRLQFLPALAARDDAGVKTALDILAGWMDANPPGRGVNWISGIEAASRLVSTLAVISVVKQPLTETEDRRLRAFIEAHAAWIDRYPSLYSSANNHRVAELAALFLAGLAAPNMASASRYRTMGRAGLEDEILQQFHADGVGAEQSPTYGAYSLEWFVLAGRAADDADAPMSARYKTRAAAAADQLRWMIDDGGQAPRVGDDDEGRVLPAADGCAGGYPLSAAIMTERWLADETPSLQTFRTGVRTFPEGGYTVSRTPTPQGVALFVFDHGPLGFLSIAAHGHADALSIWLNWGEEPIIVDAGTYLYHSGRGARDAFRGTPAHNTLSLDGWDQSRIAGPFNWSGHAETRLVDASGGRVVAEHNGYRRRQGVVHRRTIDFIAGGYTVEDRLVGGPRPGACTWRIGYLLHPDVRAEVDSSRARLITRAGRALTLTVEAGPGWAVEDAVYSPAFNMRDQTHRLVLIGKICAGAEPVVSRVSIQLHAPPGKLTGQAGDSEA